VDCAGRATGHKTTPAALAAGASLWRSRSTAPRRFLG
jgi:hypothetical protein